MSKILLEGGNVWDDVAPFNHEDIPTILNTVNQALTGTNIEVIPVGSAATPTPGKKSGDMDVVADEAMVQDFFKVTDAKAARKALAQYIQQRGFMVAQTGINVHVRVPLKGQAHQVDIMVTPNAKKVAVFHKHAIPVGSPYKGVNKQLLMAVIAKDRGLMWSAWQGLFARDPAGKKAEFITDDYDKIAEMLLGSGNTAKDLGSVESILASLPPDYAKTLLDKLSSDPNWKTLKENKRSGIMQGITETVKKQRLDPKCWDGYKKQGTKVKGVVRVNNCVKK